MSDAAQRKINELEAKVERLKVIQEISRKFTGTLDCKELIDTLFTKVLDVVNAEAGSLWMVDSETGESVCEIAEGPTKDQVIGVRLAAGAGVVGACIETQKPSVVFDTAKDRRFAGDLDSKTQFQSKSMLCAPLVVEDRAIGALQIINKKGENSRFGESDLDILLSLASTGAAAISSARLHEAEKKLNDLAAIQQLSNEITATLDVDAVLLSVVTLTSKVISYERGTVALVADDDVFLGAVSDADEIDQESEANRRLRALSGWISRQDSERLFLSPIPEDRSSLCPELQDYLEVRPGVTALWAMTLKDSEGVLGVLLFEGDSKDFIRSQQLELVAILANQTTVAIRNSLLYGQTSVGRLFGGGNAGVTGSLRHTLFGTEKRQHLTRAGVALLVALLVTPIPSHVTGDCEVIPQQRRAVYSATSGVVDTIPPAIRLGSKVAAGDVVLGLDSRDVDTEITKLQKSLQTLEGEMRRLQADGDVQGTFEKTIERDKARLDLATQERTRSRISVATQFGGTVLTPKIEEKRGESISKGDLIAEIAEGSRCYLEVKLGQEDVVAVDVGDSVRFYLAGFPTTTFDGTVESISPTSVGEDDARHFLVRVHLDEAMMKEGMLIGMSGRASIRVQSAPLGWRALRRVAFTTKKLLYF